MGMLAVVVNHTKKQFFFCDASKWIEVHLNPYLMYGIIEFIRSYWNGHNIEFTDNYILDEIKEKGYQKIEVDWKDYRADFEEC